NATVAYLEREQGQVYSHLRGMGERLAGGLKQIATQQSVPALVTHLGPVIQLSFTSRTEFRDYRDTLDRDQGLYRRFAGALAERGVRTTSRGTFYISAAHSEADIEETLDRAEAALSAVVRA